MDFVSAIKRSKWVRRVDWRAPVLITGRPFDRSNVDRALNKITYEDLIARDWIPYEYHEDGDTKDDSELRFSLLELE